MSPDPTNPQHYQFSNGAQTIDITENLTSNGGQAVQYIARSTRVDGANKGNSLEDLAKARWFIDREMERLSPGYLDRGVQTLLNVLSGDLPLEAVVGPDEPRVWRTLADVPINITVLSAADYVWEYTPLGWRRPGVSWTPGDPNWRVTYGPWTEVL